MARRRGELPGILENAENHSTALAREVLCGLLEQLRELDGYISLVQQPLVWNNTTFTPIAAVTQRAVTSYCNRLHRYCHPGIILRMRDLSIALSQFIPMPELRVCFQ